MTDWYKCPNCTKPIPHGVQRCSQCKCVLDWRQIPPTVYMQANGNSPSDQPPATSSPPASSIPPPLPGAALVAYGGIICVNCGRAIIPVKSQFNWGCFLLGFGLFYLIYHAVKRADVCPICGKNAYKRTDEPLVK